MTIQVGDIVRIIKQPEDLLPQVVGETGYIDDILEDKCSFHGIRLDGSLSGGGCIPLDCVTLEPGEEWKRAKAKFDAYREQIRAEGLARGARLSAIISRIAEKHSVSPEKAKAIFDDIHNEWGC